MKTPRASFVIPVHNGQAYLAETLESCLNQSNSRFEAVVVDDGSTDSTRELIEFYQKRDDRVKPVLLDKNVGRSMARNRGIAEAKSEIILTLDADDINIPDRVERTIQFFKKNPSVDICYSKFHNIDEWGNIYTFKKDGVELAEIDALPFDFEKVKKSLEADGKGFTGICHSSMSFKKNVFDKVQYQDGPWSEHGVDDWRFQIDSFKAGFKFAPINRCLVQYRAIRKQRDEEAIKELKKQCLN